MLRKIRSKYVLNIIFGKLKKRKELNLIKYNKKIIDKLNIKKNDFEDFIFLMEFNKKYNLKIKDIEIFGLNLNEKKIGNEIFEYLKKLKFKELKGLNLSWNQISDIKSLKFIEFNNLEILNLKGNKIKNINIL